MQLNNYKTIHKKLIMIILRIKNYFISNVIIFILKETQSIINFMLNIKGLKIIIINLIMSI